MVDCSRCGGTGWEHFEEDGRMVQDACYHCGNTGQVDPETDFQDRLTAVAEEMAHKSVQQTIRNMNSDPDGEGFDFCAAENMTTPWELEQGMVMERIGTFLDQLSDLTFEQQKEYVRKSEAGESIDPI